MMRINRWYVNTFCEPLALTEKTLPKTTIYGDVLSQLNVTKDKKKFSIITVS